MSKFRKIFYFFQDHKIGIREREISEADHDPPRYFARVCAFLRGWGILTRGNPWNSVGGSLSFFSFVAGIFPSFGFTLVWSSGAGASLNSPTQGPCSLSLHIYYSILDKFR